MSGSDIWNTGYPKSKGWYICRIDGDSEEVRLYFFMCELSPKKRYWTDENSQRVLDRVEWREI